ncbi:GxxExxY protein [Puniceicoccus vermicola]|uniref:Uncharacterized protein n=1 Tax=Puniceicoccus vermicola TaxID=388746 RepID=A0A7X1AV32_9BACT|nr:hypothetical protein [Puniceicoccus vermicola]
MLESSFPGCLSRELELAGIGHECEAPLPIEYKGISLECGYRVDNFNSETHYCPVRKSLKLSWLDN